MSDLTPLMRQYERLKKQYPDCILFFRLGDFYEMFDEDAKTASNILQIVLTQRQGRPMCGVPFHSAENYLLKLIQAGKKVAVAEQVEEPLKGKKLVERDIVKVLTPGTFSAENFSPGTNNFILSIYPQGQILSCALADVSTGELFTKVIAFKELSSFLASWNKISEVIYPEGFDFSQFQDGTFFEVPMDKSFFSAYEGETKLKELLKVSTALGFDIKEKEIFSALGGLFGYLERAKINILNSIRRISRIREDEYLFLDASSIRNLELVDEGKKSQKKTLFGVLAKTLTPQGTRLLKRRILNPFAKIERIKKTQEKIRLFFEGRILRERVKTILLNIRDISRISNRIASGALKSAGFMNLLESLKNAKLLSEVLGESVFGKIDFVPELLDFLERSLKREEDGTVSVNPQIHPQMLEIKTKIQAIENWIKNYEEEQKEQLKISKLKVGYNSVFGYYIEITKTHASKVPSHYIRKQTLVNAERFITLKLKEKETEILVLKEKEERIEKQLWEMLSQKVRDFLRRLEQLSDVIAEIDFACAVAEVSRENNYVFPEVNESDEIFIENSRHPVVEVSQDIIFTPNDVLINRGENQIMLITGPNMAGKSTYIRQVALCVIMAQMGCPIPASSARIGLVDRIFTRIGAGDNISGGASTFMVEMIEAANILNNSTRNSLIIIDELGRGTSTFDGISIAWACLEDLAKDSRHPRCLFATHFFELVELEEEFSNIKNYNVAVREFQGKLHFLHKIERGPADRSYGIHVARLAGIPENAIKKAREILKKLEANQIEVMKKRTAQQFLPFLNSDKYRKLIEKIKAVDIDRMRPIEALNFLSELKEKISE
ncbi:MAG: DNA mismatch repair protein MutS [Elusimicrobia bacterium]|nr:DNA mismatch repair protein MutS [Elusimicrobiota bacterium]